MSAGFHGFVVTPVSGESVTPFQASSGVVFLPSRTAPAARTRATGGPSTSNGPSALVVVEPRRVGQPIVSSMSLIDVGTPSSGPRGSPACQRASDSFADASAASASTRQNALTSRSNRSIRSSASRVACTGEISPERYPASSSVALRSAVSVIYRPPVLT